MGQIRLLVGVGLDLSCARLLHTGGVCLATERSIALESPCVCHSSNISDITLILDMLSLHAPSVGMTMSLAAEVSDVLQDYIS